MIQHFSATIVQKLREGKIGVIPTDTLYGLVGSALNAETVERIYAVRKRDLDKPFIILIADSADLALFGVYPSPKEMEYLNQWWPGKVSIIFSVNEKKFPYLHRGTRSLAFRCPDDEALRDLLRQTGPLVAPSANPQNFVPAVTIATAQTYFGDDVDFYVDGGVLYSEPSTLVRFENEKLVILRQGAVAIFQ